MQIDDDGNPVRAGDVVAFAYGIPPVRVEAKIRDIGGILFAMTPGHKPDKCKLSELRRYVGSFYRIRRTAV